MRTAPLKLRLGCGDPESQKDVRPFPPPERCAAEFPQRLRSYISLAIFSPLELLIARSIDVQRKYRFIYKLSEVKP
jgi:hypothetical protein